MASTVDAGLPYLWQPCGKGSRGVGIYEVTQVVKDGGRMGCVAPAVQSKLGWVPRHCQKNGVKPPLFLLFLLCCRLPPKLGETAKVYRIDKDPHLMRQLCCRHQHYCEDPCDLFYRHLYGGMNLSKICNTEEKNKKVVRKCIFPFKLWGDYSNGR